MIDASLTDALERAASADLLLVASDYDGTLSPIVDDPSEAIPENRALAALRSISERQGTRCLIVSGRSVEALVGFVGRSDNIGLIGNHGADAPRSSQDVAAVEAITAALDEIAGDIEGVLVEGKPTGAALHYRHAMDKAEAAGRARTVANQFNARIIEGKMVVEMSVGRGDKGTALDTVRRSSGADVVIFFGDDVTDETAFAILGEGDIGVKVGEGATLARYRVSDPREVADALEALDRCLAATRG